MRGTHGVLLQAPLLRSLRYDVTGRVSGEEQRRDGENGAIHCLGSGITNTSRPAILYVTRVKMRKNMTSIPNTLSMSALLPETEA